MYDDSAITKRIQCLCSEKSISTDELAARIGFSSAKIERLLQNSQNVTINDVKKICDGLHITLGEFFSVPAFDIERRPPNVT